MVRHQYNGSLSNSRCLEPQYIYSSYLMLSSSSPAKLDFLIYNRVRQNSLKYIIKCKRNKFGKKSQVRKIALSYHDSKTG